MTSSFAFVFGIRIHYNIAYPNNEPSLDNQGTIVLIHGFLSNTFTWNKCLQKLANRTNCRVLAYDRLGFGDTERVLDGKFYTRKYEELIAIELLVQLNISNNVHLVSNSSGAVVAFDLAIARPDLIRTIIFIAPYGLIDFSHSAGPIGRYLIGTKPIQNLFKFCLTHFFPFKYAYFNQDVAKEKSTIEGYLRPIRNDPLFFQSLALFTQNYDPSIVENQWKNLNDKLKILIIIGEQDKIVERENIEKFYKILKQNRSIETINKSIVISQCGHVPQEERPDDVVNIINEFIYC